MRLVSAARFPRLRASVVVTAVAAVVLSGLAVASPIISPASADGATGAGGEFVPLQARILDTRPTSKLPVDQWQSVQVTGVQNIPTTGVAAVAVNFTALDDTAAGYLKADKQESPANDTSTYLLWNGNGASTNSGVVAVGTGGKIQVEAKGSTTDLLIDVQGYYTSGDPAAGGFVPVPESRLVDTRSGTGLPATPLASGSTTTVQVSGSAAVPADASAVMLNFLVVNQTGGGSLIPYPADSATVPTQKLLFDATDSDSTTSAVGLSASGALNVKVEMSATGSTDLVIDVLGYFTADQSGGAFTPAESRVYDSRATGNTQLAAGATRTVQVAGVAGVPSSGIGAVMANVGIFDTGGSSGGWTHVWPDDQTEPNPSMAVQYVAGQQASNIMTVALGADGGIKIHNMGSDTIDFAVDIEGWYSLATVNQARSAFEPDSAKILDTAAGVGGYSSPMQPNAWRSVQVTGVGGIPTGVTAVEITAIFSNAFSSGYVYTAASPGDESTSIASAAYVAASQSDYSNFLVPVSPTGQIEIETTTSTDVALTVNGAYVAKNGNDGNFYALEPTVIASSNTHVGGLTGSLAAGESHDIPVATSNGVPADASAVMLRMVETSSAAGAGVATIAPTGQAGSATTLSWNGNVTRTWSLPVPLTSTRSITLAVSAGSNANLDIAAIGYFVANSDTAGDGGIFVPTVEPLYDAAGGNAVSVPAQGTVAVAVAGVSDVPSAGDVSAILANVRPAGTPSSGGQLGVAPDPSGAVGPVSTPILLNYSPNGNASAVAAERLPYDGDLLLTNSGSAPLSVNIDLQGWYTLGVDEDVNPDMTFSDSDPDPGPNVDPSLEASDNPDAAALDDSANLTSTIADTPNSPADVPSDSSAAPAAGFTTAEMQADASMADADDATPQASYDQASGSTFDATTDAQSDCQTANSETSCYTPVSMTDAEWANETVGFVDAPVDSSVTDLGTKASYDADGIATDGSTVEMANASVPHACFTKRSQTAVLLSRFEVCFHTAGILTHYSGDAWPDGSVLITGVKLDESDPLGSTATTTWWMRFGEGAGVYQNTIDRKVDLSCHSSVGINNNCGSVHQSDWSTFDTHINDPAPHKQIAVTRWTTDVGAPTDGTTISSDTSMVASFAPGSHNVITKHTFSGGKKIDVRRTDHMSNIGTVFPAVMPVFTRLSTASGSRTEESAKFVLRAQKEIPNHIGSFDYVTMGAKPLVRTTDATWKRNNRKAACKGFEKENAEDSCDEYPFASTRNGAWKHPYPYSRRDHVRLSDNRIAGSFLGGFYSRQRVIDGDPFYVFVQ